MSAPDLQLRRQMGSDLLAGLQRLVVSAEGQWWRDVLAHRDLFLAVRDHSLNVYYRGASLFRIVVDAGKVVPQTHIKYLVRQRQAYATMAADGKFVHAAPDVVWSAYEGQSTLNEMMAAARALAGREKAGLHALIMAHPKIIDVELSLRGISDEPTDASEDSVEGYEASDSQADLSFEVTSPSAVRQDRLDAVTLEDRNGSLWIVFHEAKHFANKELRAGPGREPPVSHQIARYRATLQRYAPALARCYTSVCSDLVQLHAMRDAARAKTPQGGKTSTSTPLDELITRAAKGETLHVDTEPRLIVFGFDRDQRDGEAWQLHSERLRGELGLTVYAIGDPKMGGSAAFQRRSA